MSNEWRYIDRKGRVQGPFLQSQMREWYGAGFLPHELRVQPDPGCPFAPIRDYFPNMPVSQIFVAAFKKPSSMNDIAAYAQHVEQKELQQQAAAAQQLVQQPQQPAPGGAGAAPALVVQQQSSQQQPQQHLSMQQKAAAVQLSKKSKSKNKKANTGAEQVQDMNPANMPTKISPAQLLMKGSSTAAQMAMM
ncbi:unnamed protein product, partial [Amoebophrya sp. A120]|eukprot:GSA120T00010480001.1